MSDTPEEGSVPVSERFRRLEASFTEHADRIERRIDALVLAFNRMGDATEALVASLEKLSGELDDDDSDSGDTLDDAIDAGVRKFVDNKQSTITDHDVSKSGPWPVSQAIPEGAILEREGVIYKHG